ncbi:S1 family peptidase [Chitinophaga rhizophila]|uniref:S1 family peptidase n=1 Tax=Chitinophaga rhizophila TaxID=2866212 RepID=A0ABS7G9Z5_9BACT|nr:S1 family peptidase [Chitinophaga rhizophila]MBW8684475.1 S1 family peptidase [Chitinophaga rhizophila]
MKMKTYLTLLAITLSVACFTYSCSKKGQDVPNTAIGSERHTEQDANPQWQAIQYYNRINESFGISPDKDNSAAIAGMPDYYGGAFINKQHKLVVYVKGDVATASKQIADITGAADVIIKPAKFSYKELTSVMDKLNNIKLSSAARTYATNYVSWSLMDAENKVVVELENFNDQKISEFKKTVLNSPAIEFRKSAGRVKLEVNLDPGCKAALNTSGTSYGSYAFRARRTSDSQVGMVTAGHVVSVGGTIYNGSSVVGTCSASIQSGSTDVAFIPVTNTASFTPTNTLCGTSTTLSTSTSLPGVGTLVNMRGATTGTSSGNIISTNASTTTAAGISYTNLTTADYASAGGDSGGIIYTYVSASNTRFTVGLHLGAGGTTRYFTKAGLALSAIGATRY